MIDFELIRGISIASETKIVLLVIDGLGGLPLPETGRTELETARCPNLDRLAGDGICGLADPVALGITPGSGPGHMALFGYDPVACNLGRGVLEAAGVDFDLRPQDVAARGNFATIDADGNITDRRAGRISTERSAELCGLLDGTVIEDVTVIVQPVKEHRLLAVFRGEGLVPEISDTDPQQTGVPPRETTPLRPEAEKLARVVNSFLRRAGEVLAGHHPANMALLRGFASHPDLPRMGDIYRLNPAAIAAYPMYRGLARLVGMEILDAGTSIQDEFEQLKRNYDRYNYFFVHVKGTDSAGEDGDFARKARVIEEVDSALPAITSLQPDVLVVTGDHSTPALLASHSWHPVPALLSSRWCRPDRVQEFSETACVNGGLGRFPTRQLMLLAMAHALKLQKFGA